MTKACANCFADVPDDAVHCPECGRGSFFDASAGDEVSQLPGQSANERPDGSGAKTAGLVAGAVGLLLILWSVLTSAGSVYGEIDADKVALKATLSLIGGGLLQIALVVWLAGYIAHAISFLPGKSED